MSLYVVERDLFCGIDEASVVEDDIGVTGHWRNFQDAGDLQERDIILLWYAYR